MSCCHAPRLPVLALSAALAMPAAAFDSLTVVGLFRDKAMVEIDGKPTMLAVGRERPDGLRLISADAHQAVIEYGGERKTYSIGTRIAGSYTPAATGQVVHIAPSPDGSYVVSGSINGFAIDFLVDTGADAVAMNRHTARRIGIDYKLEGAPMTAETASGTAPSYLVTLARLSVGSITLRDVRAFVIDGDYPSRVLLGNTALNQMGMERHGQILELHGH